MLIRTLPMLFFCVVTIADNKLHVYLWYLHIVVFFYYRQMYLTRLDHVDDDTDDELITNMEPIDVFVNSNEPTFTYGVVKSY
jgi:hypothetical protein